MSDAARNNLLGTTGPAPTTLGDAYAKKRAPKPALILTRNHISTLMSAHDYLAAVEAGFRSYATGNVEMPSPMCIAAQQGAFHIKGARIVFEREYVAVKLNGNFPGNPRRSDLPTIQGALLLCAADDGSVLAIMDSIEITAKRTAAATALAARLLARRDAQCIAICGCGEQGRAQLAALAEVLSPQRALVWDVDLEKARDFACEMRKMLAFDVRAVRQIGDATLSSDVIVTATNARTPFLARALVSPGTFVAAIGADSAEKSELVPELMAHATIVVDVLSQCAVMGDLHHAIDAGFVTPADVHAELGEIVVGRKAGRANRDQIIVFDSTGVAFEDAASAARIYERAIASNIGSSIVLGAR
ncbi:MAG TPA: ornithine cyclodeaminase family protein [Casimicrobiaceae bacterium]|jgi:ornithine cyclodeaminase/alanine dehydrogenase-like protein (mu-crystallin family)